MKIIPFSAKALVVLLVSAFVFGRKTAFFGKNGSLTKRLGHVRIPNLARMFLISMPEV